MIFNMNKNENLKIVYVILHYNAFDITCQCVECILTIAQKNSQIVIVDNNSSNGSGEILKNLYKQHPQVHVVCSDKNLGFAKGNNLGYSYARNFLGADIVVDMNNDILIRQPDFEKKLIEIASQEKDCAVIAPDIINKNGFHQNPFRCSKLPSTYVFKSLLKHCVYFIALYTGIGRNIVYHLYHKKDLISRAVTCEKEYLYNIIPHGSCVIFLPDFVVDSPYAFVPITFFYCEEDILYDYLISKGKKSLYTDQLRVVHMEKVSTNTISNTIWGKEKFQVKNKILSKIALLKYRFTNYKHTI